MPTIFDTKPKKREHHVQVEKPIEQRPAEEKPVEEKPVEKQPTLSHAEESINALLKAREKPIGLFASYSLHPYGIKFANQEPDEVIILFLRRHFITNVPWILATFLLYLIPPAIFLVLSLIPTITLPGGLTFIVTAFYYLICSSYAFSKFISWFYNIGVVTQKRIVDLDSLNILAHNTATANFNEIVDVKFDQRGFFQSTFDYGNIHIQTEAIAANFEFDAAPKPTVVTDIISDLRVAQKGHHRGGV